MHHAANPIPPVFIRPALDDGFFGRGDIEFERDGVRAVLRKTPRPARRPARVLPLLSEDQPTILMGVALPPTSRWSMLGTVTGDFVPTERVSVQADPSDHAIEMPAWRAATTSPPWEDEVPVRWRAGDVLGLPLVAAAAAALWAGMALLF